MGRLNCLAQLAKFRLQYFSKILYSDGMFWKQTQLLVKCIKTTKYRVVLHTLSTYTNISLLQLDFQSVGSYQIQDAYLNSVIICLMLAEPWWSIINCKMFLKSKWLVLDVRKKYLITESCYTSLHSDKSTPHITLFLPQ